MSNTNWSEQCPICGKAGNWRLSGTGRHYVLHCAYHGFVRTRRHPMLEGPPQPTQQPGLLLRLWRAIFGGL